MFHSLVQFKSCPLLGPYQNLPVPFLQSHRLIQPVTSKFASSSSKNNLRILTLCPRLFSLTFLTLPVPGEPGSFLMTKRNRYAISSRIVLQTSIIAG